MQSLLQHDYLQLIMPQKGNEKKNHHLFPFICHKKETWYTSFYLNTLYFYFFLFIWVFKEAALARQQEQQSREQYERQEQFQTAQRRSVYINNNTPARDNTSPMQRRTLMSPSQVRVVTSTV